MANLISQAGSIALQNCDTSTGNYSFLFDGITNTSEGVLYPTEGIMAITISFIDPVSIDGGAVYVSRGEDSDTSGLKLIVDNELVAETPNISTARPFVFQSPATGTEFKFVQTGREQTFAITEIVLNESVAPWLTVKADTFRVVTIERSGAIRTDTKRAIPGHITNTKSLSITLSSKTLSDTFSISTYTPVEIGSVISGQIKNFPYSFLVENIRLDESTGLCAIGGAYDIDEITSRDMSYTVSKSAKNAANIMYVFIATMGKQSNVLIDNHVPTGLDFTTTDNTLTAENQGTMLDIITKLFGWTDKIPHQLVNVFERGNVINVLQRGKEQNTITLEPQKCSIPTIRKKKIRTLIAMTTGTGGSISGSLADNFEDSENYLSGTYSYGDQQVSYSNGLVYKERHGTTETTYDYSSGSPPAFLRRKTITRPRTFVDEGQKIVTDYYYSNKNLVREVEVEYDSSNNKTTERITRHRPLGQGFWGTDIEIDGEIVSTSLGRGNPGGEASPYSVRTYSRAKTTRAESETIGRFNGDGEFPVSDATTVARIASGLTWLNGKTEERVNLTCYQDTIVDFTSRVIFRGNEYYLENNVITQEPRDYSQQIELVRWY